MTINAFTAFFFDTFGKRIPADARAGIQAYWDSFRVKPCLILTDTEINSKFGTAIDVAAVKGPPCLHRFAFRQFIVEHAPDHIAQTIIQHELIHCYCDRRNTPKKFSDDILLRPQKFNHPMDLISQSIVKGQEAVLQIRSYNAEE